MKVYYFFFTGFIGCLHGALNLRMMNMLSRATFNYLVGRTKKTEYRLYFEHSLSMGVEIDKLGVLKLKNHAVGDTGTLDDRMRSISGGRLLGSGPILFLQMPQPSTISSPINF